MMNFPTIKEQLFQTVKEIMTRGVRKKPRLEKEQVLLATMYLFSKGGEVEVSLSEFLGSIQQFQGRFNLGYKYWDKYVYSPDLIEDINNLQYRGYIRKYEYKYDAFLPKSFLSLTSLGKGFGKTYHEELPELTKNTLEIAVDDAINKHAQRWRFYSRKKP